MFLEKKLESSGFTLIEIAVVILIMGFMSVPFVRLYINYYKQEKENVTEDNIIALQSEIGRFYNFRDAYPLPARKDLPTSDINYGRSITSAQANSLAPGSCLGNSGVCKTPGLRDTTADPDTTPDFILIGALPIRTMRDVTGSIFSDNIALDGWNNKMVYAVTQSLTDPAIFQNTNGVIRAIDENYNYTAGINDDAHYVILSHGSNGVGAFSNEGGLVEPCGSIVIDATDPMNEIIITSAIENHNCNIDGRFMQGLQANLGNSVGYNDDYVVFGKTQTLSLWENSADRTTIFNKNLGNVGVNTPTPTQKLDVDGTLRARTLPSDGISANNQGVLAEEICSSDGSDCFPIASITSATGMACDPGEVVTGLSAPHVPGTGTLNCATPVFPTLNAANCGSGWIHGIKTNGDVICFP